MQQENIHVLLAVAMLHNCVRNLAVSESDVTDIVLDHFASLCFHVLSFTRLHRTQWPNITITDNDNPTSRVLVALQKVFLKQSEISSLVSEVGWIKTWALSYGTIVFARSGHIHRGGEMPMRVYSFSSLLADCESAPCHTMSYVNHWLSFAQGACSSCSTDLL